MVWGKLLYRSKEIAVGFLNSAHLLETLLNTAFLLKNSLFCIEF